MLKEGQYFYLFKFGKFNFMKICMYIPALKMKQLLKTYIYFCMPYCKTS